MNIEKIKLLIETLLAKEKLSLYDVKLDFEGDFNPMMAMMIKGPISKFIEIIIFQISDSLLLIVIFIQAISFIQQTC